MYAQSQAIGQSSPPKTSDSRHNVRDGLELRMVPLVRDLFRQHVHHPEQDDEHDRNDEDHEQRQEVAISSSTSGDISDACAADGQASNHTGRQQTDDDCPRGVMRAQRETERTFK